MARVLKYKGTHSPNLININAKAMDVIDVAKVVKVFGLEFSKELIPVEFDLVKTGKSFIKVAGKKAIEFTYGHDGLMLSFNMTKPFGPNEIEVFTTNVPSTNRAKKETIKFLLDLLLTEHA